MKSVRWHHHYYYEISSTATDQVLPDSREHLGSSSKWDPHSPPQAHTGTCTCTRPQWTIWMWRTNRFYLERAPSYVWVVVARKFGSEEERVAGGPDMQWDLLCAWWSRSGASHLHFNPGLVEYNIDVSATFLRSIFVFVLMAQGPSHVGYVKSSCYFDLH